MCVCIRQVVINEWLLIAWNLIFHIKKISSDYFIFLEILIKSEKFSENFAQKRIYNG